MASSNQIIIQVHLTAFARDGRLKRDAHCFIPVSRKARDELELKDAPFSSSGNLVFADFFSARLIAARINEKRPGLGLKAGTLNAAALLHEIMHVVCAHYRQTVHPRVYIEALSRLQDSLGEAVCTQILLAFVNQFPPPPVYEGKISAIDWLTSQSDGLPNSHIALEELMLLRLANENPAFAPVNFMFDDSELRARLPVDSVMDSLESSFALMPAGGPGKETLLDLLRAPMRAAPDSLSGQLAYIRSQWGMLLGSFLRKLLSGVDMLAEEQKAVFSGPGPSIVPKYEKLDHEYEAFSQDKDWMPRVVMIAKSTLVWLDQLSKQYGRPISTLDAIPDQELDILAARGFNALWLIGLWERSDASRRIKQLCGNPEAAASAYALFDYEIANELGGWAALENLRHRAGQRGIRLAADMVPNHTGIDSAWIRQRPDLFIQRDTLPYPSYSFNGENLSQDPEIGLWLEDHYYSRSDAAVVFKRVHFASGHTTYIYHGNDGTSMPWNDTAQIDFLKPEARAAVIERILHVARNFPIIRFDAAMIMAKRHFRRLWYPEPGHGGDIASRSEYALSRHDFDTAMPQEFWREVVDICARETPDCLLLAEAFWMMEGYFVRTLGMHRVYNSAFMNMLREKENKKYRETIKNTQEFDKDILKRFVNFMNNPDEETAANQFGKDDHYIGVCTLMATLPGLPMFGHGQVEGFAEKYGMEYRRAYRDEQADGSLVARHEHEIFPILKKRYLFSDVEHFALFDLHRNDGSVDDNVFAFVNGHGHERALVLFNNAWERSSGTIHQSSPWAIKHADGSKSLTNTSIARALRLEGGPAHYLIMQEQRSGLWFIRQSDSIHASGLFVELDGFRSQVFLNIYEAVDSDGAWTLLHTALQGRGIHNIQEAAQDIRLQELHTAFNAVFGSRYLALGHHREAGAAKAGETPEAEHYLAKLPNAMPALLAEMATAWQEPLDNSRAAALKAGNSQQRTAKTDSRSLKSDKSFTSFVSSRLTEVLKTIEALNERSVKADSTGTQALNRLLAGNASPAYALLASLAFQSLFEIGLAIPNIRQLALDRKLREGLLALGLTAEEAARIVEAALIMADFGYHGLPSGGLQSLVDQVLGRESAAWLLGLNSWDGICWIKRERFEQAIVLAAAQYACPAMQQGQSSRKQSAKLLAEAEKDFVLPLLRLAEANGWKLDGFRAGLTD